MIHKCICIYVCMYVNIWIVYVEAGMFHKSSPCFKDSDHAHTQGCYRSCARASQARDILKTAIMHCRAEYQNKGGLLLPYTDPDATFSISMGMPPGKEMDMHKVSAAKALPGKNHERSGRFTKEEDAILLRAIENAIARCVCVFLLFVCNVCDTYIHTYANAHTEFILKKLRTSCLCCTQQQQKLLQFIPVRIKCMSQVHARAGCILERLRTDCVPRILHLRISIYIHIFIHTYIYIYIYICID